ncbi:uncharacterized protein Z518_06123 [Rhinocladiella mackenziei CBS 650.93]|uniref:Uncharacterized protein n=1 Tax=Rhinocladiella mackenziei CBS 650.93 TaxID=1442369 RepID=A0A0D2IPY8_9EURO|nr:uncharacterized protein Z518_06123 [Rhinocladiella mackenziei CBS 650.93]KIX05251.1 hypothetical protein Z518_06123 [Rhinocladiella mackenziei CBS 650.93]
MDLSVGVVSGLIAIAITLMQLIVPNALVVILVAALSQEHSAVTWSVVSRSLSNSLWPVILRSDMAASNQVPSKINLVTWVRPLSLALIAAAAIVTPMGLYEGLILTEDAQPATFSLVDDSGIMGYGTLPRSDLGFSRQCWGSLPVQCPGTTVVIDADEYYGNATIVNDDYDRRIPEVLVRLYQSGLHQQPRSVSSYFDIQARQYQYENQYSIDNQTYLVDSFRPMGSMVLDDSISLIDGLVVDMRNGGVGFRKHTAPSGLRYGAEWDEDILFLEPETVCVNTNITLEVQVSPLNSAYNSSAPSGYLVDQGGYVNVNKTSPWLESWHRDLQDALLENNDPSLSARAYRAAWWMNVQNMYYLNVTKPDTNRSAYMNSEIGHRFPVNNSFTTLSKDQLAFEDFDGLISGIPSAFEFSNGSLEIFNSSFSETPYYPNPWNITTVNYTDIQPFCTGAMGGDYANMTNIDVRCGLLVGPSKRVDGSQSSVVEPGSWWTRPIYSCSSATKATIKTIRFNFNATTNDGLNSLTVIKLTDKVYQNKSSMPLWGVETPDMELYDLDPFFGLISPDLQNSVNLSTIRSEKLYVPASSATVFEIALSNNKGNDFNPGVSGPAKIWNKLYSTSSSSVDEGTDYSAASNLALLSKWQRLSANATGAAHIINLIWTDYAANYFVGTRSWLTDVDYMPPNLQGDGQKLRKRQDSGATTTTDDTVPIQIYERRIRYHLLYGIPAAICLVMTVLVSLGALLTMVLGHGSIGRLRHYIWSLSAGRMLGAFLFPKEGDLHSDTKVWIRQVGWKPVRIGTPDIPQLSYAQSHTAGPYSLVNQKDPAMLGTTTQFEPLSGNSPRQRPYMA